MGRLVQTEMSRDTTEPKYWEAPVAVVWLKDLANRVKSLLILIILAHEMERAGARWVTV